MADITPIKERTFTGEHSHATAGGCARCGGDHVELPVVTFHRPILDHEDGFEWRWWATCPATGDPILIADRDPDAG